MIEVRDLSLAVGGDAGRWLVRDLSLDVDAGARIAVLGRSGAGKTTLLRALAGLTAPQRGTIALDGKALREWEPRLRARRIAWLPQRAEPWSDAIAQDIVALGRTPHLGALAVRSDADRDATRSAMERVGVLALAERSWSTLSGGERQRVMIARMLASGARVLLLDEPTSALDVGHAMRVMQCCDALAREGAAIVFATHELELARRFADRVVCIGDETSVGSAEEMLVPERMAALFGVRASWGRTMVFE